MLRYKLRLKSLSVSGHGDSCAGLPLPGGGGVGGKAAWAPPPDPPTPSHQKSFHGKNEIYQRGPKLEVDFRYTKFLASDPPTHAPPPPPGYSCGCH